ncbi:MAG: hypothetical protein V3T05_14285 [Myxococcota bacterium]
MDRAELGTARNCLLVKIDAGAGEELLLLETIEVRIEGLHQTVDAAAEAGGSCGAERHGVTEKLCLVQFARSRTTTR